MAFYHFLLKIKIIFKKKKIKTSSLYEPNTKHFQNSFYPTVEPKIYFDIIPIKKNHSNVHKNDLV